MLVGSLIPNRSELFRQLFLVGQSMWKWHNPREEQPGEDKVEMDVLQEYEVANQITPVLLQDTTQVVLARLASGWFKSAMPTVRVPPLVAAAFCVSVAEGISGADIRPPWDCFAIEIDPGLVQIDFRGQMFDVHTIVVRMWKGRWEYIAASEKTFVHQSSVTNEALFQEQTIITEGSRPTVPLVDADLRTMTLCRAIIRGVLLKFSDPNAASTYLQKSGQSSKARRQRQAKYGDIPPFLRYVLTNDVTVDAREVVRKYGRGERSSPSVQTLVRGFFRRQHYGSNNALVKTVWIHPHWRGRETLPVAVKTHVIPRS